MCVCGCVGVDIHECVCVNVCSIKSIYRGSSAYPV